MHHTHFLNAKIKMRQEMQLPESALGSDKHPMSSVTPSGFWVLFFSNCVACSVSVCFSPDMGGIRFLETLDFTSVSVS